METPQKMSKRSFKSSNGQAPAAGRENYVTPEQPTVYLTFDDGPSKLTDKVLDILEEEGVKATFSR